MILLLSNNPGTPQMLYRIAYTPSKAFQKLWSRWKEASPSLEVLYSIPGVTMFQVFSVWDYFKRYCLPVPPGSAMVKDEWYLPKPEILKFFKILGSIDIESLQGTKSPSSWSVSPETFEILVKYIVTKVPSITVPDVIIEQMKESMETLKSESDILEYLLRVPEVSKDDINTYIVSEVLRRTSGTIKLRLL